MYQQLKIHQMRFRLTQNFDALELKWEQILASTFDAQLIKLLIRKDFAQGILPYSFNLLNFIKSQRLDNIFADILLHWLKNKKISPHMVQEIFFRNSAYLYPQIEIILSEYYDQKSTHSNYILLNQIFNITQQTIRDHFLSYFNLKPISFEKKGILSKLPFDARQQNLEPMPLPDFIIASLQCFTSEVPLHQILQNINYFIKNHKNIHFIDAASYIQQLNSETNLLVIIESINSYLAHDFNIEQKQYIVNLLLILNSQNDTVINLGLLNGPDNLQLLEEQIFIEQWCQSNQFKKKLWLRFQTLISSGVITYSSGEYQAQANIFKCQNLTQTLFFLVRKETSKFMINNSQSEIMIQFQNSFTVFPGMFTIFCLLDKNKLLIEEFNILILKSLTLILAQFEKMKSKQEVFNVKLSLCHFLIECLSSLSICNKAEVNIFSFLHQLIIQAHQILIQLTLDVIDTLKNQTFPNSQKVLENLECLHLVLPEYEYLINQHQDRGFLLRIFQFTHEKYKNDLSSVALNTLIDKMRLDKLKKSSETFGIISNTKNHGVSKMLVQLF